MKRSLFPQLICVISLTLQRDHHHIVSATALSHRTAGPSDTYHAATFNADQNQVPYSHGHDCQKYALTVPKLANDEICNTVSGRPVRWEQASTEGFDSARYRVQQGV